MWHWHIFNWLTVKCEAVSFAENDIISLAFNLRAFNMWIDDGHAVMTKWRLRQQVYSRSVFVGRWSSSIAEDPAEWRQPLLMSSQPHWGSSSSSLSNQKVKTNLSVSYWNHKRVSRSRQNDHFVTTKAKWLYTNVGSGAKIMQENNH